MHNFKKIPLKTIRLLWLGNALMGCGIAVYFALMWSAVYRTIFLLVALPGMMIFVYTTFIGLRHCFAMRDFFSGSRPASAVFLLYLLLSKSDRETIPGDLDEEFTTIILPKFGAPRALVWYWIQTIRTIAYRNVLCRWLLIGGGIVKVGEWITHKIRI